MFLISECPSHGDKACPDVRSLAVYVAAASACQTEVSTDPHGHMLAHIAEGTDCWVCCPDNVLDPTDVLAALRSL